MRNLIPTSYRQGDVLLIKISELPADARELKRDTLGRIVLAYGEVTGHAHAIRNKGVCSFTTLDENEIEFLVVGAGGATLRHELDSGAKAEHDEVVLPEGNYRLAIQCEYTPAELQRVAD